MNQFYRQSSGNAFVSETRDLKFESQAGQIGDSVAKSSPPLPHFFEKSCGPGTMNRKWVITITRYTRRHNQGFDYCITVTNQLSTDSQIIAIYFD